MTTTELTAKLRDIHEGLHLDYVVSGNRITAETGVNFLVWDAIEAYGIAFLRNALPAIIAALEEIPRLKECERALVNAARAGIDGNNIELATEIERLRTALQSIADYAEPNGCCPYGCDCPHLAREALKGGAE